MPSPIGHILAGAAVYLAGTNQENRSRLTLGVTLLGSILPDFDFIPGILIGDPAAFHHGISHSFTFAVVFGVLVYFVLVRFDERTIAIRTAILAALAYAFHVILDVVNVNEGTKAMPIFWPFTQDLFGFNLHLFGHFHHDGLEQGIWSVVRWDNVPAVTRELVVMGLPTLGLFLWKHVRHRSAARRVKASLSLRTKPTKA